MPSQQINSIKISDLNNFLPEFILRAILKDEFVALKVFEDTLAELKNFEKFPSIESLKTNAALTPANRVVLAKIINLLETEFENKLALFNVKKINEKLNVNFLEDKAPFKGIIDSAQQFLTELKKINAEVAKQLSILNSNGGLNDAIELTALSPLEEKSEEKSTNCNVANQKLLIAIHHKIVCILRDNSRFWDHRSEMGSRLKHFSMLGGEEVRLHGRFFRYPRHIKALLDNLNLQAGTITEVLESFNKAILAFNTVRKAISSKSKKTNAFYRWIGDLSQELDNLYFPSRQTSEAQVEENLKAISDKLTCFLSIAEIKESELKLLESTRNQHWHHGF